jgi:hypothetical protein
MRFMYRSRKDGTRDRVPQGSPPYARWILKDILSLEMGESYYILNVLSSEFRIILLFIQGII